MKSQFLSNLYLEAFKATCTFLFGFISFKIFQRYKNKKDNTKLYIKIIKLEKEIKKNKLILEDIINEYEKEKLLEKQFYINGVFSAELYNLYKEINSLSWYIYKEFKYDEIGEVIDCNYVYGEKPYEIIEQLSTCNFEYDEWYVDSLEGELEYYKKQNIYDNFKNIERCISKILINDFDIKYALEFLYQKLKKYNSLSKEKKFKYLNSFCSMMLDKENKFTYTLNKYKELERIKTISKNKVELKFKFWEELDIELLAIYNTKSYLQLENFYSKLNNLTRCAS